MNLVQLFEKATIDSVLITGDIMPTPKGKNWESIMTFYGLPEPVPIDKVLSKVTLPKGWKICKDPEGVSGRKCLIKDETGSNVGGFFLKNALYDYFGSIWFDEDRLVELGVINKNE